MSERTAVQNPMLCYVTEIGRTRVLAAEALNLREGEADIFFMAAYLPDWEEQENRLNLR